jgi:hypothetical protein
MILPAVAALVLGACGGPSLGEPQEPTASQKQASTQMTNSVDQIAQVGAKADNAFLLQASVQAIGGSAVNKSARKALYTGLTPQDLPSGCVTGDGKTGYTYNNCNTGSATLNGSVKISGMTTEIDLQIKSSGVSITFSGSATNTGTKISGTFTWETKVDLGGLPVPGGAGGQKYKVTYDIGYKTGPYCIESGSILVEAEGAVSGAAKFEWTGCSAYKVRNG